MWIPGNTKPRSANKRITQQKLFNLRRDARTGLYTLTELAVMHKMSYGHVAKLCRSQKLSQRKKRAVHTTSATAIRHLRQLSKKPSSGLAPMRILSRETRKTGIR